MNCEIVKTDITQLKPEHIRWRINSSSVQTGNTKFQIHRASPFVLTSSGKESPLIIQTDKIFTFGVKESTNDAGEISYSIPLSVVDWKQPTEYQKAFVKACDMISESGKSFLLQVAASIKKDWVPSDLRKVSVLWRGKDPEKPTLYAKLPARKGNITCSFYKPVISKERGISRIGKREVNPLLFRDVMCHVKAIIKIESIFIGSKVTFQTKVEEVLIFPPPKKVSLLEIDEKDIEGLEEEEQEEEEQEEEDQEEVEEGGGDLVDKLAIIDQVVAEELQVKKQETVHEQEEEAVPRPRKAKRNSK
jgi:hypothetical protein